MAGARALSSFEMLFSLLGATVPLAPGTFPRKRESVVIPLHRHTPQLECLNSLKYLLISHDCLLRINNFGPNTMNISKRY